MTRLILIFLIFFCIIIIFVCTKIALYPLKTLILNMNLRLIRYVKRLPCFCAISPETTYGARKLRTQKPHRRLINVTENMQNG